MRTKYIVFSCVFLLHGIWLCCQADVLSKNQSIAVARCTEKSDGTTRSYCCCAKKDNRSKTFWLPAWQSGFPENCTQVCDLENQSGVSDGCASDSGEIASLNSHGYLCTVDHVNTRSDSDR